MWILIAVTLSLVPILAMLLYPMEGSENYNLSSYYETIKNRTLIFLTGLGLITLVFGGGTIIYLISKVFYDSLTG